MTEVDNYLYEAPDQEEIKPPVHTRLQNLPFNELGWDNFERLCCRLALQQADITDSRIYGERGDNQKGIDFYAIEKGSSKPLTFQCKREKQFGPRHIENTVSKFLEDTEGGWSKRSSRFFLCTSVSLKSTQRQDSIFAQKDKLSKLEIELIIWDSDKLEELLKTQYPLVEEFFSKAWADGFCQPKDSSGTETSSVRPKKKEYNAVLNHIPRTVKPVIGLESDFQDPVSILGLIDKNRLSVILGFAGSGKSVELENLAHHHSNITSRFYPIKIRLNTFNNEPIEKLLQVEYSELENIPEEQLLIILDGLDEVHVDLIDHAVHEIIKCSEKYAKAKFVVSCRNNFYTAETNKNGTAKLSGFSTFLLEPLTFSDRYHYVHDRLGLEGAEKMLSALNAGRLNDLTYSPFYLVQLVDIFEETGELPASKQQVFERLIEVRISADLDKYVSAGANLHEFKDEIEAKVQQLGLISLLVGKNYLSNKEFNQLVKEGSERNRIVRSFLFDKANDGTRWQFEHNMFQEYLGAKLLATYPLEKIKQQVAFGPNFDKLKPSWVNTLSLLFSQLDTESEKLQELIRWLSTVEPDVVVRFEREKVPQKLREKIFEAIFTEYELKGIIVRNKNFELRELGAFVADSKITAQFLLNKVETSTNQAVISESARLLVYLSKDVVDQFSKEMIRITRKKLSSNTDFDKAKYECLHSISDLGFIDKTLTQELIAECDLTNSQYIRAGVYRYLQDANACEENIDLLLKGVGKIKGLQVSVNGDRKNGEPKLDDEERQLKKAFEQISSLKNIRKILRWAKINDSRTFGRGVYFDLLKHSLNESISLYKQGKRSIWNEVLDLLEYTTRWDRTELKQEFKKFFEETETALQAFKAIGKIPWEDNQQLSMAKEYARATVIDKDCIEFIIDQISDGKMTHQEARYLRNTLNMDGDKELAELFQTQLLALSHNDFAYAPNTFEKLRSQRDSNDRQLLLNRNEFRLRIKSVFQSESKDGKTLERKTLFDYRRKAFNDEENDNNIISDTIRKFASDFSPASLDKILEFIDDENRWNWYQIQTLVAWDSQKEAFEFNRNEKVLLRKWVKNQLKSVDFDEAIVVKANGGYTYIKPTLYLAYLVERINMKISHKWYLEFIKVDCYLIPTKDKKTTHELGFNAPRIVEFVIEKVGKQKVKSAILGLLQKPQIFPQVKLNLLRYCTESQIPEASKFAFKELLSKDHDDHMRHIILDYYVKLDGDMNKLFGILDELPEEARKDAIEILAQSGHHKAIEYCLNQIHIHNDEQVRLGYIKVYLKLDENSAIPHLEKWVAKNQTIPEQIRLSENVSNHHLQSLLNMYLILLTKVDTNSYRRLENNFLDRILHLGSLCEQDYLLVKEAFEDWAGTIDSAKFLYYQIQELDQRYYSNLIQAISFQEAVKRVGPTWN